MDQPARGRLHPVRAARPRHRVPRRRAARPRRADGQPLGATDVRATYRTPAMEAWFGKFFDGKDLPSAPKIQLLFNAAVDPDQLTPFLKFQNTAGQTIAAIARTPDKIPKD